MKISQKNQRILKLFTFASAKFLAIGLLIFSLFTAALSVSVAVTGQTWPLVLLVASIAFVVAIWDYAKVKVESEIQAEENLIDTLSRKHEER